MCLFPSKILNPRFKKNPNINPALKYVTAKCGTCIECRQQRAREWQQRLEQENAANEKLQRAFITFTVTNQVALEYGIDYEKQSLHEKDQEYKEKLYELENKMMKDLVRKWRLKCEKAGLKKRQFLITEHGDGFTERIHMHGIIWSNKVNEVVEKWTWGIADKGDFRDSTIPYLVKYMYKEQTGHETYRSIILATPGIGNAYVKKQSTHLRHRWRNEKTTYTYILKNGRKVALCEYYMKKIFSEYQRNMRRLYLREQGKQWVKQIEYNTNDPKSYKRYIHKLMYEQAHEKMNRRPKLKKNDYNCNGIIQINHETFTSNRTPNQGRRAIGDGKNQTYTPNLERGNEFEPN
ncbi:replication initiator protein [Dipodfec virus UOA04_Rod_661]|nr:replication initiator protein [Dipodfec virus UOA04_Rod_661]